MNLLKNTRCYLSGAIDCCPNLGTSWRNYVSAELKKRYDCIIYNPMDKGVDIGEENKRHLRSKWKKQKDYESLSEFMKQVRQVDLMMANQSNFGIFYLDKDIFCFGTVEEFTWMNQQKKPCLIVCKQGKEAIPDWAYGCISSSLMFDNFDQMFNYLDTVNQSICNLDYCLVENIHNEFCRWLFLLLDRKSNE